MVNKTKQITLIKITKIDPPKLNKTKEALSFL